MTTDFTQLELHPQLMQAITELGYSVPMPIQMQVIPLMIARKDVIGQAQTGTGKTAAFALPILHNLLPGHKNVQALVLAPTRELALQVAEAFSEYGKFMNVRVQAVYGGASYAPQISALKRGADVVVGTPGRLMDLMEKGLLDISQVRTVILDEADEMLSMGFVEDIQNILSKTPAERQTALFSATLSAEIRRLAETYMHSPESITVQSTQLTVPAIEQRYYLVNEKDKLAALTRLFEVEEITSALIFVRTRAGSGELANELTARGFPAEALNGDLSQEARERTLNRFRQNKLTVLVATDVAARGLDIDDISHVFNFDLPDDHELYVHRIGRTGRAGKTGIAITLLTPYEKRDLRQIEAMTRQKLVRAELPTEETIKARREMEAVQKVNVWLTRGRCKRERELVEQMVAQGHDPLEIAAAALKVVRAEEKQRPIYAVTEVMEPKPARTFREDSSARPYRDAAPRTYRDDAPNRGGHDRPRPWGNTSHEAGMVRLSLSMGREQGIRPNDIVGAIAGGTNIPGHAIGKIFIQDNQSLVDIPEEMVAQVLGKASNVQIRRLPTNLQRA